MERRRINFNVPAELYRELKRMLPFRGEVTAFLTRCIEAAVASRDPSGVLRSIEELLQQAKKDAAGNRHRED